jgi:hypothetical protein
VSVTLYVLDAPEFQPIAETARAAGMTARKTGDYLALSTDEPHVVLHRDHTGMRTALWFAALTGGVDGRIVTFDEKTLHLEAQAETR